MYIGTDGVRLCDMPRTLLRNCTIRPRTRSSRSDTTGVRDDNNDGGEDDDDDGDDDDVFSVPPTAVPFASCAGRRTTRESTPRRRDSFFLAKML